MTAQRCADYARTVLADPIGTATSSIGYVVVGTPLPWPSDVNAMQELESFRVGAASRGWRLQAVATEGPGLDPIGRFWRSDDVEGGYASDQVGRHVLICGHGRRDRCCGSDGTRLLESLKHEWRLPERVWRSSHLGGHRFAPTALILPEGTMWANVDSKTLHGIVDRSMDVSEASRHYRGCTLIDDPLVQIADRCALARHGWGWLDHTRRGEVLSYGSDEALIRIRTAARGFTVRIAFTRCVPTPACGDVVRPDTACTREYGVVGVHAFEP